MQSAGKILILTGVIFILIGAVLTFYEKIPLIGKLPGDIIIKRKNFMLYFPIATSVLISILLSLVFYFINKKK